MLNSSKLVKTYVELVNPIVLGQGTYISVMAITDIGELYSKIQRTSPVIAYWPKTGAFETMNTIYEKESNDESLQSMQSGIGDC